MDPELRAVFYAAAVVLFLLGAVLRRIDLTAAGGIAVAVPLLWLALQAV